MTNFGHIEYPWPRAGDDPFALNNDAKLIARLNLSHDVPWRPYAEGFKRLADLGVQQIAEIPTTGADRHFLVYPIFFNYRHCIELSLKLIIEMARDLLDRPDDLPKTHNCGSQRPRPAAEPSLPQSGCGVINATGTAKARVGRRVIEHTTRASRLWTTI